VKLSELPTLQTVVDRQREDPEFREEWDRTVFAREVAIRIVRYRAGHPRLHRRLRHLRSPVRSRRAPRHRPAAIQAAAGGAQGRSQRAPAHRRPGRRS
jgi:hypothetical protein